MPSTPSASPHETYTGGASLEDDGKLLRVPLRFKDGREGLMEYRVEHLDPHPSVGKPAIRLVTSYGESYDVIVIDGCGVCECPDFEFRRRTTQRKCKHCMALKDVGLISFCG